MHNQLDMIFRPRSIAVIGASNDENSVGFAVTKNLLSSSYEGAVHLVNPKYPKIQNRDALKSISQAPKPVDLAVIATPAQTVPAVVEQCGRASVGGVFILSGGFKEAGKEGQELCRQILKKAHEHKIRIVGPNCLGFINPYLGINASFATKMALPGNIAFISQSGALCTSILDWAVEQSVGFSYFVSIGSTIDVGIADMIDYFGTDPHTSSILIYMESLLDARRFMSAARAFARSKPIIVLKAGRTEEGGKAALSHIGSLAGNDAVYDAAFRRAGVIRVDTIEQLFDCAQSLAMQPRPEGNRLAILTNAGGAAVLATDYLVANGGSLAALSEKTLSALDALLPAAWSHGNPVDALGDVSAPTYRKALEICLADPGVDGLLAIVTTQAVTEPSDIAREVVEVAADASKPMLASWLGERDVWEGREILEQGKVPNYRYPESAVDVFLRMYRYSRNLRLLYETPPSIPADLGLRRDIAETIIGTVLEQRRTQMMENEAKELIHSYGIPTGAFKMVQTAEQAAAFADEIGYPVVMKIVSPDIGHKTEVGGVKLNLRGPGAVRKAFEEILESAEKRRPDAEIRGVLIERMADKAHELLIGAKKDPLFGPVIAFGKGGVAVEIERDLCLGLPPLNRVLARHIISGTRIYRLLEGYRGMEGVDLEDLELILCRFAYLVMDFPEIREIDINPFGMDSRGGIAMDAHVVLERIPARSRAWPYHHLVISPYPEQHRKAVLLRNGQVVELRPIRPEDEPLEAQMLDSISKESLNFRFFGLPYVTHDFLSRFTDIDYDREMAIIGVVEEAGTKKMVGVVRIISDAWGETAEFAILVADAWQRQGLGEIMTDYILDIARNMGLRGVYAWVLASNEGMLQLFRRYGFKMKKEDSESYFAELELD